jgi:hypothetical protein
VKLITLLAFINVVNPGCFRRSHSRETHHSVGLHQLSFLPSSKTLVYCAAGAVALLLFATQRSADTSNDIEDGEPREGRGSIKAVAPPGPPRDHVVVVFCISGGNKRFIEEGLLVSLRSVRVAPPLEALSVLQTAVCSILSAQCRPWL